MSRVGSPLPARPFIPFILTHGSGPWVDTSKTNQNVHLALLTGIWMDAVYVLVDCISSSSSSQSVNPCWQLAVFGMVVDSAGCCYVIVPVSLDII